jgi:hypothetical protein
MQVSIDFRSLKQAEAVTEALQNAVKSYRSQAGLTQATEEERDALAHKAYLIEDALANMVKP